MVTEDPSLVGTKPLSLDDLRETWPILVPDERADGFRLLTRERGEEYFAGLSARDTADLLERFTPSERRSWLRVLPPDDIADVAQEMDPDRVRELLALLDPATRSEVNALLAYAEDAAGGLMSPRFAHVRPDMRSDEAIAYLRRQAEHLETMYYIYVIDKERKLLGVCSFRELFVAPRDKLVRDVMRTEFVAVQEEDDQEDVARIFAEQDLMVVPVLDSDRRMKGIVTHDDIVDVVEEEATEDMHKMGGMEALEMPYLDIGFFRMIKKRGLWLGVLFVGQMLTIPVLEHYKHQFAVASYLMFFVPLIIASGGMTGSQAATLVIRAMALSEVKLRDWWRVMRREVRSGLALGCLLAGIGLTAVGLLQFTRHLFGENFLQVALIVPLSLLGVVVFGTVFGSLLPFIMGRMGFDSASASTPFVATIVDISGLIIYLSTAQLILYLTLN